MLKLDRKYLWFYKTKERKNKDFQKVKLAYGLKEPAEKRGLNKGRPLGEQNPCYVLGYN